MKRTVMLALLCLFSSAESLHASLQHQGATGDVYCGGNDFTGREFRYSDTDSLGNTFTLECVNRVYFEGTIKLADGTTFRFGRCIYDWGANHIEYNFDADGNFDRIVWVNIDPNDFNSDGRTTAADRDGVSNATRRRRGESKDDWLDRVRQYKLPNGLGLQLRIYDTTFSPNEQDIATFDDFVLLNQFTLTPSEANAAYLSDGYSHIPDLVIDPAMALAPFGWQVGTNSIPEPASAVVWLGLACVLGVGTRLRRRRELSRQ